MSRKKLLIYLLAASLALPATLANIPLQVHAEESANLEGTTSEESTEDPKIITPSSSYSYDETTGYICIPEDFNPYSEEDEIVANGATTYSSLPSAYHGYSDVAKLYPATRNQGEYGTCWAHACVACAEFDLINEGVYTTSVDLSELQLAYNMYHTGDDLFGNLSGDTTCVSPSTGKNFLTQGGNTYYAQHILANWRGLSKESSSLYYAYSYAGSLISTSLANSVTFTSDGARLENSRIYDKDTDTDAIKQAIIDHGAVTASYYHNSSYYTLSNGYSLYYNSSNPGTTNHAIAIVGWNDNFSRTVWPSSNRPSIDGAWLVRNSWSTTTGGSEYSYFWMSYADTSLADAMYELDFGSPSNYDSIYQHDGSPYHIGTYITKAANVFTAKNTYASGSSASTSFSETLEAVMIPFTHATNVNLKIEIYTGLTDSSNPESGQLHSQATTYASTTYKGIYTFDLNKSVHLAPGETYAIVVTALNGPVYFDLEASTGSNTWLETKASATAGESFYSSSSTWCDMTNTTYTGTGNLCIKGFTKKSPVQKYLLTYELNGGERNSSFPSGYLETDSYFSLPTPTRSGYHFLGWYTDSAFTNKVSILSGSTGRNLKLYAKWEAHSYSVTHTKLPTCTEQGTDTYTCTCGNSYTKSVAAVGHEYEYRTTPATLTADGISNYQCKNCDYIYYYLTIYRPSTIALSYTSTSYTGSAKKPTVTVTTTAGTTLTQGTDYTVTYKNNVDVGQASVVITFKGDYSGTTTKYFTITKKTFTKVTLSKTSYTYDGKYKKPTVSVYSGSTKLSTSYYTVSYKNNKNAGTATVTVTGKGKYANYKSTRTFTIKPKTFTKVTLSNSSYGYNGKAKKPTVKVYVGSKKLSSSYYTVTYSNNINIGKATVTITGKGKYANYKSTKTFKINPAKQVIQSISTNGERGTLYVTHTYDSQCTGYQVQISTKKSFSTILSKGTFGSSINSWYIYGLASNKTHYVRVRSYAKVNGTTYYGAWSTVKSKKTL